MTASRTKRTARREEEETGRGAESAGIVVVSEADGEEQKEWRSTCCV